ncbi:MAG: hypothetical protein ACK5MS_14465, partial [Planctomyces sp.]
NEEHTYWKARVWQQQGNHLRKQGIARHVTSFRICTGPGAALELAIATCGAADNSGKRDWDDKTQPTAESRVFFIRCRTEFWRTSQQQNSGMYVSRSETRQTAAVTTGSLAFRRKTFDRNGGWRLFGRGCCSGATAGH